MRQALKAGNSGLTYQANYEKDLPPTLDETDRFFIGFVRTRRKYSEITQTLERLWRNLQIKSSRHTRFLRG